jgi:phenylalanyl-tRNA synthetase beta chain
VLGVELPLHAIEQAMVAIGATVVAKPEDGRIAVEIPGWRPDLAAEIDLVEEVARVYGYERIPAELRPYRPGLQTDAPQELAADRIRQGLVAEGLLEAVTLPLGPPDPEGSVELLNPISADYAHLRRRLLPSLVREVERNWTARVRDIRLFEIGTAFLPRPGRPDEEIHVAAAISGAREPPHWTASGKAPDYDAWDLKGLFETMVSLANPGAAVQVQDQEWVAALPDGRRVGWAGRLAADAPKWAGALFGCEVVVDPAGPAPWRYQGVPATPAVERDLALVVPEQVTAAQVLSAARVAAGAMLESLGVVDEYRGAGVRPGARSLALRFTFRVPERTLRDPEVDDAIGRVCSALERTHGIVLRTA